MPYAYVKKTVKICILCKLLFTYKNEVVLHEIFIKQFKLIYCRITYCKCNLIMISAGKLITSRRVRRSTHGLSGCDLVVLIDDDE